MRTKLDLPEELIKNAKIEAARREPFPVLAATSRDGHPITADGVRRDELDGDLRLVDNAQYPSIRWT